MKKLFSVLLAIVLVFSLTTVAFAAVDYAKVPAGTEVKLTKTYENENNVIVTEKLTFTSVADSRNPVTNNVTVDDVDVDSASETITVKLPEYDTAGTYRYTIKENPGTAAGVTYSTDIIRVIVYVGYDNTANKLVILHTDSYIEKAADGKKNDVFKNTFASGKFSVAKEVTGNMADQNDEFKITVELKVPAGQTINTPIMVGGEEVAADKWAANGTYTTTLDLSQADGVTTFENIPVGVAVKVTEDVTGTGYELVDITNDGELTVADDADAEIVVTNKKTAKVETGINLDSVPFVVILVLCALAAVLFITKRRKVTE